MVMSSWNEEDYKDFGIPLIGKIAFCYETSPIRAIFLLLYSETCSSCENNGSIYG